MTFATQEDDQTSMMINVLQGDREMAKDNTSIGLFKLEGIPKAPKYEQKVEVTFEIDANGILTVSAEILETGKLEVAKVADTKSLSQEELMRRIMEATKFIEEDEIKKEVIENQNRATFTIYATQKFLEETNGKISNKDRRQVEMALNRLNEAMKDHELQKVREFTSKLLELKEGLSTKLKKVSQAKMLLSSLEDKLGGKFSDEKKKKLQASVRNLEEAPYERVTEEFCNLRETVILLEADFGED